LHPDPRRVLPGASYHDIAALDVYDGGYDAWKYDAMQVLDRQS
jgi:hypothetical protein